MGAKGQNPTFSEKHGFFAPKIFNSPNFVVTPLRNSLFSQKKTHTLFLKYYEQDSGFSLRDIPINRMRDTRNQPEFSYFSRAREAG